MRHAPVAQGIERRPPKPGARVRIPPGVLVYINFFMVEPPEPKLPYSKLNVIISEFSENLDIMIISLKTNYSKIKLECTYGR